MVKIKTFDEINKIFSQGYLGVDISYLEGINNNNAQLNQINIMLAIVRQSAIDEETHFHGAAIIRSDDGRFYIDVNKQTGEAIERNCAERRAIDNALGTNRHSKITDLWFMGGVGYLNAQEPFSHNNEGEYNYPCGSCLQQIGDYQSAEGVKIHLLPLNDGSIELENNIITKQVDELFTCPDIHITDRAVVGTLCKGLEYFESDGGVVKINRQARLDKLAEIKDQYNNQGGGLLEHINSFMVKELKRVCADDTKNIRSAAVAIVRRHDGEMFVGNNVHSKVQPSTPSAIFTAISNATGAIHNPKITDVWKLKIDFENLPNILRQSNIKLATLRGDELERVKKFSVIDENGSACAKIRLIAINNGVGEVELMVDELITFFLPFGFQNPKKH